MTASLGHVLGTSLVRAACIAECLSNCGCRRRAADGWRRACRNWRCRVRAIMAMAPGAATGFHRSISPHTRPSITAIRSRYHGSKISASCRYQSKRAESDLPRSILVKVIGSSKKRWELPDCTVVYIRTFPVTLRHPLWLTTYFGQLDNM